jgi:hypothetical protein
MQKALKPLTDSVVAPEEKMELVIKTLIQLEEVL